MNKGNGKKIKEYDFLELIKILIAKKYSVVFIMSVFLLCAIVFLIITPSTYKGNFYFEIGGFKKITKDNLNFGYNIIETPSSLSNYASVRFSSSDFELAEALPVGDKFLQFTIHSSSPEKVKEDIEYMSNILVDEHKSKLDDYLTRRKDEIGQLIKRISLIRSTLNSNSGIEKISMTNETNLLLKYLADLEYNLYLNQAVIDSSSYKYSRVFGPIMVSNQKIKPKEWFVITLSLIFGLLFSALYVYVIHAYTNKKTP